MEYKQFIGKEFIVKGFNEPRKVKIEEVYFLANRKGFPAFRCSVLDKTSHFNPGDRENFLAKEIIKNGKLVDKIKVLSA